ncbi:4,4'-diaponeurosporenoate glycosyltransferase [Nocardioides alpinus]|uniref:4,4'-diaponeurosporenoate glycosyltransferase n=1 Tax=Nocardioides alpinus TaxID=748909 RepID=A0A1I1AWL7_9ACTN|nr:glycosyltransferase family 2 protein [Nocardioides alpinus]SFB42475.1 4,4'-diaponeurosporenoate glycosyltransferase [Nocardioides alpinus]
MTDLLIVLVLLVAAAVPLWLLRDLRTVPQGAARTTDGTRVSVVVPARDEEQTLPGLLRSLRDLAVAEVIVVDDASRDATATVAHEAGALVLPAGVPPDGWTGKAWACHTGSGAATGDVLLFLDADTVLAPDALDGLLQLHADRGGLVSVQPFHRVLRPYEQLSAYFNVVALMASGAFIGRPPSTPMAFGPCLLTSRTDYDLAGGHEAVRGAILDDVRLAEAYDRAGLPVTCAVGARSVTMRSYPGGLSQLVSGWTKNIASGASAAGTRASLAAVLWICAHHAVAVGALLGLLAALTGRGDGWTVGSPLVWTLAWVGLAWQLRGILRRAGSFRWWTWALFPLPLLAFDLVFARSAALTVVRRSVSWRGRPVDLRHERSAEEVG